jgi:hypothetical protein
MHAEVHIDDTVVMIAVGGDGWRPIPSYVHIYVNDAEEIANLNLDKIEILFYNNILFPTQHRHP